MYNIATMADLPYLSRALALCESLADFEPKANVFVLTLGEGWGAAEEKRLLTANARVTIIPQGQVETVEIRSGADTRNWVEYIWLFQPALPAFLLRQGLEHVLMLDADICLFYSLKPLFAEIGPRSVAVFPHRFSPSLRHLERTSGRFNGGATFFRNDEAGLGCVDQWAADCLEWDYVWSAARPGPAPQKGQICGTQGYLNLWPEQWNAYPVAHLGCNLAPWNQGQYYYMWQDDRLCVETDRLIFYHFHGLISPTEPCPVNYTLLPVVREHIYAPYFRRLSKWNL